MPTPADPYGPLQRTIAAAARTASRGTDATTKVRALTDLLAALYTQVVAVTAERDAVLIAQLREPGRPSNRTLAAEFSLSRQPVDQLAAQARAGGRPRSLRQPRRTGRATD